MTMYDELKRLHDALTAADAAIAAGDRLVADMEPLFASQATENWMTWARALGLGVREREYPKYPIPSVFRDGPPSYISDDDLFNAYQGLWAAQERRKAWLDELRAKRAKLAKEFRAEELLVKSRERLNDQLRRMA